MNKLPFRKAIVTTIPKFFLSNLNLKDFNVIITGKESSKAKPHPKCFLEALKRLKVKSEETLMIGNEIDCDIKPAENLGIRGILIDRDNAFNNYHGQKIKSLREIVKLVK